MPHPLTKLVIPVPPCLDSPAQGTDFGARGPTVQYCTSTGSRAAHRCNGTVQTRNSSLLGAAMKSVNTGVVIGDKLDNQIFGLSQ